MLCRFPKAGKNQRSFPKAAETLVFVAALQALIVNMHKKHGKIIKKFYAQKMPYFQKIVVMPLFMLYNNQCTIAGRYVRVCPKGLKTACGTA